MQDKITTMGYSKLILSQFECHSNNRNVFITNWSLAKPADSQNSPQMAQIHPTGTMTPIF